MAHIVVIGAGVGGMPAAYELRDLLPHEHQITVISAVDYFQFTPSNPWIAVHWRERKDITLQIAPLLERKGIGFHRDLREAFRQIAVQYGNRCHLIDGSVGVDQVSEQIWQVVSTRMALEQP